MGIGEMPLPKATPSPRGSARPFRAAVFRGMGILAPPLLTVVVFLWIGSTIDSYLLQPVTALARNALVWQMRDIRTERDVSGPGVPVVDGQPYRRLEDGKYIPVYVYEWVRANQGAEPLPQTGLAYYQRYVETRYLRPWAVVPFFLSFFILFLYLLGKFMAAGIGRFFYGLFERFVFRIPLVRNVYAAVKQVSDFFFTERAVEFKRVVAVEYPRKGMWSVGFVTGEAFLDVRAAANEPLLSVLVATSPAPMTGFTAIVKKSEVVDLNITIDQALEFIISCGVVVPPHQMEALQADAKGLTPAASGQGPAGPDGSPRTDADKAPAAPHEV